MANINVIGYGPTNFDSGAVVVSGGGYINVATLQLGGSRSGALINLSNTGAGALTHFKLTRAATAGGVHTQWLVDTDLNTATAEMLDCVNNAGGSPPNLYTLASAGAAQIKLGSLQGIQEIGIWAQGSTSLQATGTVE